MTKNLTYSAFAVASLLVIMIFVTAKSYSELAIAIALYPFLVFLALKIFPHRTWGASKIAVIPQKPSEDRIKPAKPRTGEPLLVADIDRRAFVKLIGATGASFFLVSLLGRRVETLLFGRNATSGINPVGTNDQFGQTTTSPLDGYKISDIDEGPVSYYGFINKSGNWLIMQEGAKGGSFRYAKGDSNFLSNWTNRKTLRYDYLYNLH